MEKDFTYPGPKPFSKETAIVMMADAVEASSRSLGKYTEENINQLVERIIIFRNMKINSPTCPSHLKISLILKCL